MNSSYAPEHSTEPDPENSSESDSDCEFDSEFDSDSDSEFEFDFGGNPRARVGRRDFLGRRDFVPGGGLSEPPGDLTDFGYDSPPAMADLGHLLGRTSRAHATHLSDQLFLLGLTAPQCHLLVDIARHDGVSQTALSQRHGSDPSTITGMARRLEEKGLINRPRDLLDARSILINATHAGTTAAVTASAAIERVTRRATDGFEPAEIAQLCTLLARVAENLENARRARRLRP